MSSNVGVVVVVVVIVIVIVGGECSSTVCSGGCTCRSQRHRAMGTSVRPDSGLCNVGARPGVSDTRRQLSLSTGGFPSFVPPPNTIRRVLTKRLRIVCPVVRRRRRPKGSSRCDFVTPDRAVRLGLPRVGAVRSAVRKGVTALTEPRRRGWSGRMRESGLSYIDRPGMTESE